MNIHFLGFSHTITNTQFSGCAFTSKVLRACEGFTNAGHQVFHYGSPGAEVICTEHINIVSEKTRDNLLNRIQNEEKHQQIYHTNDDIHDKTFYVAAGAEIRKRIEPGDYVMINFNGFYPDLVSDTLWDMQDMPIFIVEMSIGYCGAYKARYKVFESYCIQTWHKAQWQRNWELHQEKHGDDSGVGWDANTCHNVNAQWTDDVIRFFLDTRQFQYTERKEDYFLFVGRLIPAKGIELAVKATEAAGVKLKVAGQGILKDALGYDPPDHVEYIGYIRPDERKELMAKAKGGFVCTLYSEPCGHVIGEYGLSGTPVITTDWGGVRENILPGRTGYVVRSLQEARDAILAISEGNIASADCRKWAMNFTTPRVIPLYEYYMKRISAAREVGDSGTLYNQPRDYDFETDLNIRTMIYPDNPKYDMNLTRI